MRLKLRPVCQYYIAAMLKAMVSSELVLIVIFVLPLNDICVNMVQR